MPASVFVPLPAVVRWLKLKVGIVCAPMPLKLTVLPVVVKLFAPGVKIPATPTVPLAASVRAPVELLVRWKKLNAGIVCAPESLKFTVLLVMA